MKRFASDMARCLNGTLPKSMGVAVSGGSDSTALLLLSAKWAASQGVDLFVATVNHGLRAEAPEEARQVENLCHKLKLAHETLYWTGDKTTGNLQSNARQARLDLLAAWAKSKSITTVALGHTLDDQAETLLMRLARGSGVDGLSAMAPRRTFRNIQWIRPLLTRRRDELRDFLVSENTPWSDDPSNQDDRFERVQIRKAIKRLGLSAGRLAETAERLANTRQYLDLETQKAAHTLADINDAGDVILSRAGFLQLPDELRSRLLSHALKWVSSAPYRPRYSALIATLSNLKAGGKSTLSGCEIDGRKKDQIRIGREYQAVRKLRATPTELWDNRWLLSAEHHNDAYVIAALGETGLNLCPDWRESGLPRSSLIAGPAIWSGSSLIAAPLAGFRQGWSACLIPEANSFYSSIVTH